MVIILALKPHRERGGYHLDRFDAYLGQQLVTVSRQRSTLAPAP
jgi:hypothetical protein